MQGASIKKILWKDIRSKVHDVNPHLTKVIDGIDPGEKFPLYHASYPYVVPLESDPTNRL